MQSHKNQGKSIKKEVMRIKEVLSRRSSMNSSQGLAHLDLLALFNVESELLWSFKHQNNR